MIDNLFLVDPKVEMCRFVVVAVKSRDLQDEIEEAQLFFGRCVITRKKVRDESNWEPDAGESSTSEV